MVNVQRQRDPLVEPSRCPPRYTLLAHGVADDIRAALAVLDRPILVTHSAAGLSALKLARVCPIVAVVHWVPSPPAGFFSLRTLRVMVPYPPRILRSRPLLLDKADMIEADLN